MERNLDDFPDDLEEEFMPESDDWDEVDDGNFDENYEDEEDFDEFND
jgi:hypothetical protein